MNKQLTQEQIDSLNAVYAKMRDDSLELEYYVADDIWDTATDGDNKLALRVNNIMLLDTQYRIKPAAPKKEYYVVGATELPASIEKQTYKYVRGDGWEVTCALEFKNNEDADRWYKFFCGLSHPRNVIMK